MTPPPPPSATTKKTKRPRANAETMAKKQRDISVSEFFAKNRHLLGFDNQRKALLTTVKEAVDNSLDACEEAGILPNLLIRLEQLGEIRYRITIRDNGPGIVRKQIENVFGKLLYGSKFHRLKMSRGQQGIGIAAAGMYGLMTTGKPMIIHSKPHKKKPAHRVVLAINLKNNKADISDEEEKDYDHIPLTGTEVEIELEGKYHRGRQSIDEYLKQTAIANPHAQIIYQTPDVYKVSIEAGAKRKKYQDADKIIAEAFEAEEQADDLTETTTLDGGTVIFPRAINDLPEEPKEIKPHPKGVELGMLLKMLDETEYSQLSGFLQNEFCRVSQRVSTTLCETAGFKPRQATKKMGHAEADRLYKAIQATKLMSPPTNCLAPIGAKHLLAGLLKGERAEFYTATTRPPAVYRGNPFQIEVGMAFGGDMRADEPGRVIRFANRVPLLYQQSACSSFKAVIDTPWRNYNMSQPRGTLPVGPLVVMIHMASVWVPFTSESKEAIADYDEIRKEMKLALSECGRKLKIYLSRRAKMRREGERRDVFQRYLGEVVRALHSIDEKLDPEKMIVDFREIARKKTMEADTQFDDDGNPIKQPAKRDVLAKDETTIIVEEAAPPIDDPEEIQQDLFD